MKWHDNVDSAFSTALIIMLFCLIRNQGNSQPIEKHTAISEFIGQLADTFFHNTNFTTIRITQWMLTFEATVISVAAVRDKPGDNFVHIII